MKLTSTELIGLTSLMKAAQMPPQFAAAKKKHKTDQLGAAYPDYSKSLLTQMETSPRAAGARRALSTGALAAILGGLIGKMVSDKPSAVGGGMLAGGALGAIPGYVSGKHEAESEKSRLLFLRRLGISRPGELEALLNYPGMGPRVTEEGVQI